MGIRSLVPVAVGIGIADLAEDDDAGWTPIDAQSATGTDIVVNSENHVVGRIDAGLFGADGFIDGIRRHHVDALPRTDVDAAFAHNALGLVNVDELFWLDGR